MTALQPRLPGDSSFMPDRVVELSTRASTPPLEQRGPRQRWSHVDLQTRLPGLLRLSDWLGIALVGVLVDTLVARHDVTSLPHSLEGILGATATVNFLQLAHAYSMRSAGRLAIQLIKVAVAWSGAFLGVTMIGYINNGYPEFANIWAIVWFVSAFLLLVSTRCVARDQIARWRREGRLTRNVAVLGSGHEAFALAHRLRMARDEADVIGVFVDGKVTSGNASVAGDSDRLAALADRGRVDEVVIALPWTSPEGLNRTLSKFAVSPVEVSIDPGIPRIDYPPTEFTLIAGIPTLKVQRRPLSGWGGPLKRFGDVVLSFLLLMAFLPLLLIIALAVKIDSRGPCLFRQERYGFSNQRIFVFKFRSMRHDPNPEPDVPQVQRNDCRVTRVGAFLRRTSLDELPQLLNVLRGQMSMVGPRPHASIHNEKYAEFIDGYLGRHRMKPGITGWAQVSGLRGPIENIDEMRSRLEYDRYYLANWSVLLDIKILLMTVPIVFRGTNAY